MQKTVATNILTTYENQMVITNFEAVNFLSEKFTSSVSTFNTIIIDEFTAFKNRQAKAFSKNLKTIISHILIIGLPCLGLLTLIVSLDIWHPTLTRG